MALVDGVDNWGAGCIGVAVSGLFDDVGVQVNLVVRNLDLREGKLLAMEDDNIMAAHASSADQYTGFAEWHTPIQSPENANNHPVMTELTKRVLRTPDIEEQARLWRELWDMFHQSYLTIPMLWIHADATYDPEVVAGYNFLGSLHGTWTHVHTISEAW